MPITWGASRQAVPSYLSLSEGAVTNVFATDSTGNLFVVSTDTDLAGNPDSRIVKSDAHGVTLAEMSFGGPFDTIVAAAVDPAGNLVLAGTTYSPGFPLVQPLFAAIHGQTGFIVKLDSQLRSILFSTLLTGSESGSSIYAVAVDAKGDILVTGGTSDPTFPVTAGAFQTTLPNSASYAFVTEISADDKAIVFSTYFGSLGNCGDTSCLNRDYGTMIALDSVGNIVIGGYATSGQIPVTPGVYGSTCGGCSDRPTPFLAKFSADGSHLIWATYIPASPGNLETDIQALALDSQGNVVVVGVSAGPFPVTPGSLQTTYPDVNLTGGTGSAGFVAKFDPLAQKLLFASYFGGEGSVNGVSINSQDAIWITGISASKELPVTKDTVLLGTTYVANLSSDGTTLLYIITAPSPAAGEAIVQTTSGAVVALGISGSLLTVTDSSGPSIAGIVNSAGSSVAPVVAPKELVSIYGIDIGPSTPATAQVNQGVAPSSLEGTTVTFDGDRASLLYVSATQINAVVPDSIQGESVTMVISTPSGSTPSVIIPLRPSHPEVFMGVAGYANPAAAVNEDGTVNSASNPAKQGSIVSVWASGAGFITGGQELLLPISVLAIQRTSAEQYIAYSTEVLFAGQAPGLIKGLAQINFRLPAGGETSEFELQAGTSTSTPFTIFVEPYRVVRGSAKTGTLI